MSTDTITAEAARDAVQAAVDALNVARGIDPTDYNDRTRVTFGYIGNLEGRKDYRCWYVFLPHPGRVGTSADSIGGIATDDTDGFLALVERVATGWDALEAERTRRRGW